MSRARAARPPLPSREALRVEQRAHHRHRQRAEHLKKEQAAPRNDDATTSLRRARKRELALRRRLASGLPRPLHCRVRVSRMPGHRGFAALRDFFPRDLAVAWTLGMLAVLMWRGAFGAGAWVPLATALLGAGGAAFLARSLAELWSASRRKIPAELSVLDEEIRIRWDGAALSLPLDAVTQVEARGGAEHAPAAPAVPPPRKSQTRTAATTVIRLEDGRSAAVETTRAASLQLAAAIEAAKDDLAARRASRAKRARAGKEKRKGAADRPSHPRPAAPAPNEAALTALDRDGRPLGAWKKALRAAFAGGGYRRSPPLHPDDLLQIVGDSRVSVERRVGAALALTERGDDDLRARLRIASDGLETEVLRVAVERAAEGTLEEDALEEAIAHEALAHELSARQR